MTITNKQRRFVEEYLRDFNATQAAIRCGYSPKTARAQGSRLFTNVDISKAIKEAVEMPPDEVKARLADIARGDIADLMEITTSGFEFKLLLEDESGERIVNPKTKLIKKIKQKVTTILSKNESGEDREIVETEIELYSAHEALRDIGKLHKMFVDRQEITGKDGGAIIIDWDDHASND